MFRIMRMFKTLWNDFMDIDGLLAIGLIGVMVSIVLGIFWLLSKLPFVVQQWLILVAIGLLIYQVLIKECFVPMLKYIFQLWERAK